VIQRIHAAVGDAECARSVISIIELTRGVYRAKTEADRARRMAFAEELAATAARMTN
jgi:hypothetical protein